jgi:trimethylamine--corrinoid protein Co-methyltransferase
MGARGRHDLDILLDGTKIYGGTAGTGTTTVDLESRKRRASTKNDVAMMALISDYLPSVSFYWPMVAARDYPPEIIALHELEASFTHTEKHIQIVSCVEARTAKFAVKMAEVIAGGPAAMRTRPPLSLIASPVSPLNQDGGVLDAALVFAKAGLPVGFAPMPVLGSTAPASIAGTMVVGNAEILSSVCLLQLAHPGTPAFYPLFSAMMNPYTGGILASTQIQYPFYAGAVQLGHYYNLPVMSGFGGTDRSDPERWRVGRDSAIDAFFICATGPDLLPCLGLLDAYTLLVPEKLLFDDEIYQSVKSMAEGMQVDTEALAVDEIMAVGPGGHFLDREYTHHHIRKIWDSRISQQWSPEKQDFRDPLETAGEKIRWILKNHRSRPLDKKVEEELGRIIRAAQKELLD